MIANLAVNFNKKRDNFTKKMGGVHFVLQDM